MTFTTRMALAAVIAVIAVGGALYAFRPSQPSYGGPGSPVPTSSSPAASTAAQNPLIGTWATGVTTCAQQNAALTKAGFTTAQLLSDGWDVATCGGMKHGSSFRLQFTNTLLVLYENEELSWSGAYEWVDAQTFKAGDNGTMYITYRYTLDGDRLTIDMVADNPPGYTDAQLLGELIAQTDVYETAPYTRVP